MKAWQILIHSVRQVFGNLGAALRISVLLYVVQWVVGLALGITAARTLGTGQGPDQSAMVAAMTALFGPALLVLAVLVVADLWIAVAWHRYVLKEEASPTLIPVFEGRRMLGYFGAGLAIIGILLLPVVLFSLLASTFLQTLFPVGSQAALSSGATITVILGVVLVQTLLGALALRLSTVLPGFALAPGRGVTEGWAATAGEGRTFLALAFLCVVALELLDLFNTYVLPSSMWVRAPWVFVVQWVITMVGVSILTTLYGHYIEKRPLV